MKDADGERYLALKAAMMPRDTNQFGTIFGGVLLSYIDLAAGIGARHVVQQNGWPVQPLVTVAMDKIEFKEPVFVGDTVSFWTELVRVGRTSISVQVSVEADRERQTVQLTHANATFVAVAESVGRERRPVSIRGDD